MLIGRDKEILTLREAAERDEAQLIAVYGRRRVGKTYLIRETFQGRILFSHAGVYRGSREVQLRAFYESLLEAGLPTNTFQPKDWMEAFVLLRTVIRTSTQQQKIIFLDELSWMDTARSDLMMALEHFWNAWASARKDVVVILCSSATSWMLNKVIHNKGGLYNRLTERIWLQPFTLGQCRIFSETMHLAFSDTQIMELYMILGGVPYYWKQLKRGFSVAQNVDHLFFSEDAVLRQEYEYLFASIFRYPEPYLQIIEALAKKKMGLTRNELLEETDLPGSGIFTQRLKELESCGFIREYHAFGKKNKDSLYQLMDPFVLFYHHFLKRKNSDTGFWSHQVNTPAVNAWEGLAFEQICLLHTEQIKKKLGISGVLTEVSSFVCKANPEEGIHGSQIDMVIWRADHIINLLEMKYASEPFTITKGIDEGLRRKRADFQRVTKPKEGIHLTMVTPYGLEWNAYAGNIQSQVTGEDLFS